MQMSEDNLNCYKGKLLTSEHIKRNLAHGERFDVAYDEFLLNSHYIFQKMGMIPRMKIEAFPGHRGFPEKVMTTFHLLK